MSSWLPRGPWPRSLVFLLPLAFAIPTPSVGGERLPVRLRPADLATEARRFDPPAAHLDARAREGAETVWFGGQDGTGVAVAGGIWDFDDLTTEGWTSVDLTDEPSHVRHLTVADEDDFEAGAFPLLRDDGSEGSLWIGTDAVGAAASCWPGGQGYGDSWRDTISRTFIYGGGSLFISFDYFVDSETTYDLVYVYLVDAFGQTSPPINPSVQGDPDGFGYSGLAVDGRGIGTPEAPARAELTVEKTFLPSAGEPFELQITFVSDALNSDAREAVIRPPVNSTYGPFGIDDILVQSDGQSSFSDFEPGDPWDGWTAFAPPPVGRLMDAVDLAAVDPVFAECECPLEGGVLVAADLDGVFPHPDGQRERMISNPIPTGPGSAADGLRQKRLQWSVWEELPLNVGLGYRIGAQYYPWTCPSTGVVGWTVEPASDGVLRFSGGDGRCVTSEADLSSFLPAELDSIRVVVDLIFTCLTGDCLGAEFTNQSPYFDDIRMGFDPAPDAPSLALGRAFMDAFPTQSSLAADAPASMKVGLDVNHGTGQAVSVLGDSMVVTAGGGGDIEVYMNVRVHPGPLLDTADGWFTRFGTSALAPSWASVRIDTAEGSGGPRDGRFASYVHESEASWKAPERANGRVNPANKVLPDGFFTPGTTIEYFFTSKYEGGGLEVNVAPDTTGGFFLEAEVLPGYFQGVSELFAPCLLYIDVWNGGVQQEIEQLGLRPVLGTQVDVGGRVHDLWDRYDYLDAEDPATAGLSRTVNGDNGMTYFQSLAYRTMFVNTGTMVEEGLRNGDAALLRGFATADDLDRWTIDVGLWLSGDGIAGILDHDDRIDSQDLLRNHAGAALACSKAWHDVGCGGEEGVGDPSTCVRLDPVDGRHFPATGESYGSLRGNGCPDLRDFQVLETTAPGVGNLRYVDQDAGEYEGEFASISTNRFSPASPINYGVVLDAFSLEALRSTPHGWTGEVCGDDAEAMARRVNDVVEFFGVPGVPCVIDVQVPIDPHDPEGTPPAIAPAVTTLYRVSPNPFNPATTIHFNLAEDSRVRVEVFDVTGRRVRGLLDELREVGRYTLRWDGTGDDGHPVASGIYLARMVTSSGYRGATKLVVLK